MESGQLDNTVIIYAVDNGASGEGSPNGSVNENHYPGTTQVPEAFSANTHGVSYKILAEVEFTADSQGVIFAQGSRYGGHSLFVKDGTLTYVVNFLGIPPEQVLAEDEIRTQASRFALCGEGLCVGYDAVSMMRD